MQQYQLLMCLQYTRNVRSESSACELAFQIELEAIRERTLVEQVF